MEGGLGEKRRGRGQILWSKKARRVKAYSGAE